MSVEVNNPIENLPFAVVPIDIREIVNNSDPTYAEQRQEWINTVYGLQQRIKSEVEKITANNIEVIDARHEELVLKCKTARQAFDEMNSQASVFQLNEKNLSKAVTEASFAVRLKRGAPLTPSYSTKQDYARWESELNALVEIESAAIKRYYSHTNLHSMWAADCQKLKQAHDALCVEESQLRNQLNRLRAVVTGPQKTSIGLSA
jgi:hypothetical protein